MMSIAGQYSGNGLAYFNTVIYEQLGIKSVNQQLGYNLMSSALSAVGALAGAALSDRMPRRKVLVWGTLGKSIELR
jgi:predicted MFS family arabinose efflux permease